MNSKVIYVTTLQLKKHHTKICNLEKIKPAHESNNLALQKVTKANVLVIIVSKMYIVERKLSRQKKKKTKTQKSYALYSCSSD